jgi:hypothetical protein
MKQSTAKGLFHLALAALGIGEMLTAKGKARKALCCAMSGFHAYATYYHFVREDAECHRSTETMRDYNG